MSKCVLRYSAIAAILATALFFPRLLLATLINEVEPNNTGATAQNVNGSFSLDFQAFITDSTTLRHVSIDGKGASGSNAPDFYTFTTAGVGTIILDIDDQGCTPAQGCPDIDTEIGIWNAAGTLIATNDDAALDPGSDSTRDSFIQLLGQPAGTYIVGVCEFDCTFAANFSMTGEFLDSGEGYKLHISIPEPTSFFLLGAGLAAMGFRRRPKMK